MPSNPESEISRDVLEFLSSIEKMNHSGKIELLSILLKKYAVLGTSDIMMDKKDLESILSRSKQIYIEKSMPIEIRGSETPVHQPEVPNLCVIEATIGHLNKLGCFKRVAKFDYIKR